MLGVTLEGVSKRFGSVRAVDGVSLEVAAGELFFLLGPSGCGKTTLLRILAGFERPDTGTIRFGDRVMNDVPPHRRNTGMVFQNYALWPHLTVEDNVAYGLSVRHVARAEKRRRVAEALEMVQMAGYERRVPAQLSGGQQQRVALARALVIQPDVVLLDEPLSNLDAKLRLEMRGEIMRIHAATRITTVYVTHDQKEALSVAQRLAVIRDGRIEQIGTPQEVYRRPANEFVATFVGEANTLKGVVKGRAGDALRIETPVGLVEASADADVGRPVACCIRPEACTVSTGPPAAEVNAFAARLLHRTYLGEVEQYELVAADGRPWKATTLNPRESLQPGEGQVTVRFAPEDVMVFPREEIQDGQP